MAARAGKSHLQRSSTARLCRPALLDPGAPRVEGLGPRESTLARLLPPVSGRGADPGLSSGSPKRAMVSVVRTRSKAEVATCRQQRQKIELLALTTTYLIKLALYGRERRARTHTHTRARRTVHRVYSPPRACLSRGAGGAGLRLR